MYWLISKSASFNVLIIRFNISNHYVFLLQYISYSTLLNELNVKNIRELEDLLISAIYADIIQGRLDQQNSRSVARPFRYLDQFLAKH